MARRLLATLITTLLIITQFGVGYIADCGFRSRTLNCKLSVKAIGYILQFTPGLQVVSQYAYRKLSGARNTVFRGFQSARSAFVPIRQYSTPQETPPEAAVRYLQQSAGTAVSAVTVLFSGVKFTILRTVECQRSPLPYHRVQLTQSYRRRHSVDTLLPAITVEAKGKGGELAQRMSMPPPLEQISALAKTVQAYTGVPRTPAPRRHRVDRGL